MHTTVLSSSPETPAGVVPSPSVGPTQPWEEEELHSSLSNKRVNAPAMWVFSALQPMKDKKNKEISKWKQTDFRSLSLGPGHRLGVPAGVLVALFPVQLLVTLFEAMWRMVQVLGPLGVGELGDTPGSWLLIGPALKKLALKVWPLKTLALKVKFCRGMWFLKESDCMGLEMGLLLKMQCP